MTMETALKPKVRPARKSWIYGILVVVVLGAVAYFGLMNIQDRSKNQDYYRVLSEASNTFNENLFILNSLHEYDESVSSIRSLLPSYLRNTKTIEDELESEFVYRLVGKELKVVNKAFTASLSIEDILPSPQKGFSQYIFADENGNVLADVGGERTISIVDLSSINQQIQLKNKQFQLSFTDTKQAQSSNNKAPLPSYSNHVDMKISYGEFRVYVFPFRLTTLLSNKTVDSEKFETLNHLYLVGLLPQHELAARDSGQWNVSLMVVTIISLLFMWSMLRLYLLPKNQSITKTFRVVTIVSSYLFYIVIVALVLAYSQRSLMENFKDQRVTDYADKLNSDITDDLTEIFQGLDKHRQFYQTLIQSLEATNKEIEEYGQTNSLVTKIHAAVIKEFPESQTPINLKNNTLLENIKKIINQEIEELQIVDKVRKETLTKSIEKSVVEEIVKLQKLNADKKDRFLNDIYAAVVEESPQLPPLDTVKKEKLLKKINQTFNDEFPLLLTLDTVEKDSFLPAINEAVNKVLSQLYNLQPKQRNQLVADINKTIINGLSNVSVYDCAKVQTNLNEQYFNIGSAATSKRLYSPDKYCEYWFEYITDFSFELDVDAISILLNAYKTNKENINTLDFFSRLQTVELQLGKTIETHIDKVTSPPLKNMILSVFAINIDGLLTLPSIFYQESNALPTTVNLSHRNYYKQVRDQKGWDLEFVVSNETALSFKNVYIQRLLNVNNGTRGTTISMPLMDPESKQENQIGSDYIIGADVLLPSLSLRESPPLDFTYMIVERSSGNVLFHNDTERSLVENLYFSGDSGNKISQKIKAGLKQPTNSDHSLFGGMYHGQQGRFSLSSTVINEWAIVIFYPDDSLQALMTNQFLFISVSFTLAIGLMLLVIYIIRNFIWTSALKEKLRLPTKLNIRFVMLVSSVMLSTSYCLHLLGTNIDLLFKHSHFSIWLPLAGIFIATVLVYLSCTKLFSFPPEDCAELTRIKSRRGAIWIISAILIITGMHSYYIHRTSVAQIKSLDNYYQQIGCNSLNYERAELISTGLSRYPNSITSKRIDPLQLLPLKSEWYKKLTDRESDCNNQFAASSNPEDFPSMGSLTGSTSVWLWIKTYLLTGEINEPSKVANSSVWQWINSYLWGTKPIAKNNQIDDLSFSITSTLLQAFLLVAIIVLWFKFNIRILWYRLYCPERFIQYISRIAKSVRTINSETKNKQLKIKSDTVKLDGVGMNVLLRSELLSANTKSQIPKRVLLEGFTELFEMSPCLQNFSRDKCFLPNLKLNLDSDPTTGLLKVQIWDIDTCLEKGVFRQLLLDLIMEFKSLTLANQLHSFTIFAGFHSLQRVKMKDPLLQDHSSLLDNAEYLSWAECLMDFVVFVPKDFKELVDWELLGKEVKAFPELKYLESLDKKPTQKQISWSRVLKRDEELHHERKWATINYLLLHADALYRFKWESCSSAEKLALINLTKQNHINPMNTQMIEHLALNGLITERKGHIAIVNRSFAHFVLHAETTATLNQLVSDGEAGTWKNYKLPIGIMILLIIGGIALTSGESIYIIAASLAGVLGTIASVTNSANMLRGAPK